MHTFRVWASKAKQMYVQWRGQTLAMQAKDERGWWTLEVAEACSGDTYAFCIDEDRTPYPDPRSPRQPQGVHGPSQLYDHAVFAWHDQSWRGSPKGCAILYELHIGTFSEAGTFDGAIPYLDYLADLGVTHVEVMPIAPFPGHHGWGYDGVSLYSVHEPYGGPDGFKRFVDACHARGLGVILDVVYNHFGPVGNYVNQFAPYLTGRHKTPWGDAVNLDGRGSDEVRRFFCDNALLWLRDYHCDGLRLDAVHAFIDLSAMHFLEQLSIEVERLGATLGREIFLIAESDLNDPRMVRPREAGGYGMDAQWSDDFHHALFTLLYEQEPGQGYYEDFGAMADLRKALKQAFVYDGQYSGHRKRHHGRPVEGLSAHRFIHFDQNHDQVGNRAHGERLEHLCGMEKAKVAIGLVLLAPYIPMLFMGEEFAASSPFLYFADHEDEEMRRRVAEGRRRDFARYGKWMDVPNPEDMETFRRSRLRWEEVNEGKHAEMLDWTKQLIRLRTATPALQEGSLERLQVEVEERKRTLVMQREEVRVLVNLGGASEAFDLLQGEQLRLASSHTMECSEGSIVMPPMSLAVLVAPAGEGADTC